MFSFILPKEGILSKNQFLKLKFDKNKYQWLSTIFNKPNHPKYPYVSSLALVTDHFKYLEVEKIVRDWQEKEWMETATFIDEFNWMYAACVHFSFIKIDDPTDINIYADRIIYKGRQAIERLKNKASLSEDQIQRLFKADPIIIRGNSIINGFHRIFAMIGRCIDGKPYIPIYYQRI